jgi:hypothetical protein
MRIYRSPHRYYHLRIDRDMWGKRVLIRTWGGLQNRLGGMDIEPMTRGRLREIDRERVARGYQRLIRS